MTDFWQDDPELEEPLKAVSQLLDHTLDTPQFPLRDSLKDLVGSNGKLLRPALVIIGSRFGRPDSSHVTSLAAAAELLHVSTLIHDDVIDDATIRRGLPTLHTKLGAKEAILAGDWLLTRSFNLAAQSVSEQQVKALAAVMGAICACEIQQDLDKWHYSSSVRAYSRKIAGKTAALLSFSLYIGAAESKVNPAVASRLRRAGYDIGMAFQIKDDILDFESSEGVMRKPVGRDLEEGLCTLPLVYTLRADEAEARALVAKLRCADGSVDKEAVQRLIALCADRGGIEAAKRDAGISTKRAQSEISGLPAGRARDELSAVADKLLTRNY